jgi:hypothetical protein
MIQLISGNTYNSFTNLSEMIDCKLINDKFNYYVEEKHIDFHRINTDPKLYINLGDMVTAEEVNDIINNRE